MEEKIDNIDALGSYTSCIMSIKHDELIADVEDYMKVNKIEKINYLKNIRMMICKIDINVYTDLFKAELLYDGQKKRDKGFTEEGYTEIKPALIPNELENLVSEIHLNCVRK
ncbi:hypothetical protein ACFL1H_01010 [Nanoarchaeota archaeon]